ncbi:MAG: proton-conducting transporter membrane subunit [Spirochaetales bacterium]|nr:proton-conducting transporter membrane subunit [Spirochaetales bacterium]
MRTEDLVFMTIMLPLFGAAIAFFAKAFPKGSLTSKILEYGGAVVGLVLPWWALIQLFGPVYQGESFSGVVGGWNPALGIFYRFDGLSWLIQLLGYSVGLAAYIYSVGAGPRGPAFTGIFLIQTAALSAAIITTDMFNLFVCLEVLGVTSYVLIPTSKKPGASLAAFSYLMVSASAMVLFLVGTYGLYRLSGSLAYSEIASAVQGLSGTDHRVYLMSLVLLVSAIAIRVAVMPLYGWLPDSHALAPHAISSVLSGVLIKTPLFALSRVLGLFVQGADVGLLMSYAGAATALVAVVLALSQSDAKRLLAYHSISQIGYVVTAWGTAISIGANTQAGLVLMTAAYLHALFHAFFKGLLFLSVGTTVDLAGERNVYRLRGAARYLRAGGDRLALTFVTFLVGALSITAIPPMNGYISKNAIGYGMKGSFLYLFLTLAGVGTVASFIKLSRIYWPSAATREEKSVEPAAGKGKAGLGYRLTAQFMLAGICVATGVAFPQVLDVTGRLLSGGQVLKQPNLYGSATLLKTLYTALAGVGLFLLIQLKPMAHILHVIRERPRSFQGLFVSFSLATAALALWLLY